MTGGQLATVKVPLKQASPRLAIVLRLLHLQFLNAHLALRIVAFHEEGILDDSTRYFRLKHRLNERCTFHKFLGLLVRQWQYSGANTKPQSTPSTPRSERQVTDNDPEVIPRYNRIDWFNRNDSAMNMRLSPDYHEQLSGPGRCCYICGMKTTVQCSRCRVNLCKNPFASLRRSCWQRHHSLQTVGRMMRMFHKGTLLT